MHGNPNQKSTLASGEVDSNCRENIKKRKNAALLVMIFVVILF
jgi:hypothetical protein